MLEALLTVLLAFVWVAITGSTKAINILVGVVLGFGVILLSRRYLDNQRTLGRLWRLLTFLLFFAREILVSSLEVAVRVIPFSPYQIRPAIVAIPLDLRSQAGIVALANMITLTPGTLSLHVSDDQRTLFVHAMYVEDVTAFVADIKTRYEARVKDLLE